MTKITVAAEGQCDIKAIEVIAEGCGLVIEGQYNCRGKSRLDHRLPGYLNAARYSPWVILRDLDDDAACAPEFMANRNIIVPPGSCVRIAVRALEAWLMADRSNFADWLGVSTARVPGAPEDFQRPKLVVANLAASSRKRDIRDRMAPRPENGSLIGPEYEAAILEFLTERWGFRLAANSDRSLSLSKAVAMLENIRVQLAS